MRLTCHPNGQLTDAAFGRYPEVRLGSLRGFASQVGKTVEELTQIERQQAITNMVLEEAAKVAGVYDAAMEEPGKVLRSFLAAEHSVGLR